jgi:hypothetical protein
VFTDEDLEIILRTLNIARKVSEDSELLYDILTLKSKVNAMIKKRYLGRSKNGKQFTSIGDDESIKDCFMCKNGEVYGSLNDPSIICTLKDPEAIKDFYRDGRFCAVYCKKYMAMGE